MDKIRIIKKLIKDKITIGVMESCTGGAISDCITNIPGVSAIFGSGKVTYSEKAKIEAGVDSKVIDRYGVFSMEVAKEMAEKIEGDLPHRQASIGIGVTGNLPGEVFVAIRIKNKFLTEKIVLKDELKDKVEDRKRMKREVVEKLWEIISDNI
jgi:PncC family amidohydrolase